jgi:hypothetical protein
VTRNPTWHRWRHSHILHSVSIRRLTLPCMFMTTVSRPPTIRRSPIIVDQVQTLETRCYTILLYHVKSATARLLDPPLLRPLMLVSRRRFPLMNQTKRRVHMFRMSGAVLVSQFRLDLATLYLAVILLETTLVYSTLEKRLTRAASGLRDSQETSVTF